MAQSWGVPQGWDMRLAGIPLGTNRRGDGLGKLDLFFLMWGSCSEEGSAGGRVLACFHRIAWEKGEAESGWAGEGWGMVGG